MKPLPSRYAYVLPPIPTVRGRVGELVPSEESTSFWLWQKPELLGWPRNINWLRSRVEARRSAAGLWGIDSTGTLIIVEIRIDRGQAPDPFDNLIVDVKKASMNSDWTAEALQEQWRKCCAKFPCYRDNDAHLRNVERLLGVRHLLGNPLPVVVGLIASVRSEFRLSRKAMKNFEQLQKRFGYERVLVRVINGTLDFRGLRVKCKTPEGGCAVASSVY